MADEIPDNLAKAFFQAVEQYRRDWTQSMPEPEIDVDGKSFSVTKVCDLVEKYTVRLPESLFGLLLDCTDMKYPDLRGKLAAERTYKAGAYCLRELIKRRRR